MKFYPCFCLLVQGRVGTGHNVILQELMITTQGTLPYSQCFLRKNVKAGAPPVQNSFCHFCINSTVLKVDLDFASYVSSGVVFFPLI